MENISFQHDGERFYVTSFSSNVSKHPAGSYDDVTMETGSGKDTNNGLSTAFTISVNEDTMEDIKLDIGKESFGSSTEIQATSPYVNMTKDDVIRLSNTPFWNTFRLASIVAFWIIWLAFLVTVVALTMTTPRCNLPKPEWWQRGIFYQIYVRSFCDSDADGVGDLIGIVDKLPVIKELGATALVLSSIFKSRDQSSASSNFYRNKFDYGYEVVDYKDVDPSLGDMTSFKYLANKTREADLKLILDFVPNHSGIDHKWFTEFNSGGDYDPGWSYYVSATKKPNDWESVYGEPSWSYSSMNKLYFHNFLKTQPDVNLRSTFIQNEFESILKFWSNEDFNINGFKIFGTDKLFEDADFSNNSVLEGETLNQITRWRNVIERKNYEGDNRRIIITDGSNPLASYGSKGCDCMGSHLSINDQLTNKIRDAEAIRHELNQWFEELPNHATSFWTTGDQDKPRLLTTIGQNYTRAAKLLKFTLPGSALIYYGEELDMSDDFEDENLSKDPLYEINNTISRFGYRNPICWTNNTNNNDCGFSNSSQPWLKINYKEGINVQEQKNDGKSMWSFVRKLCKMKSKEGSLQYGRIHLGRPDDDLLTFVREYQGSDRLLISINFGENEIPAGKNVASVVDNFEIPSKAIVTLTTDTSGPYSEGQEVDLKALRALAPGYGFVATWKYKRTIYG